MLKSAKRGVYPWSKEMVERLNAAFATREKEEREIRERKRRRIDNLLLLLPPDIFC